MSSIGVLREEDLASRSEVEIWEVDMKRESVHEDERRRHSKGV
jgi:hypothetical protein